MPTTNTRALALVGRWGTADAADPRVLQVLFAGLLLLDWSVSFTGRRTTFPALLIVTALLLLTAVSLVAPWSRGPQRIARLGIQALSSANILIVGVQYAAVPDSACVVLLGMPALLLGRSGQRGVVVCAASVAAGVVLPMLVQHGVSAPSLMRGFLPALISVIATVSKVGAVERNRIERRITEALVETVGVGLQLVDRQGMTMRSNGRVPLLDHLVLGSGAPACQSPIMRAAAGERLDGVLVEVGDPDRSVFLVSARPVHDDGGSHVAAALAWQDVTPLAAAIEADRTMFASVSHDLRTPLTAVLGYVELMEAEPLSSRGRAMLSTIKASSEKLHFLIGELVTAAAARRTESFVDRTRVNVADVVRQSVTAIRPAATDSEITLSTMAPDEFYFDIDADRFALVLDNLLSNAIKYNNPGGQVSVTLRGDPSELILDVDDDGFGIPVDARDEVFEQYFRIKDTQHSRPGTGLGLGIARKIVELHGGTITVASAVGEGTTFTVRIPPQMSPAGAHSESR